MNDMQDDEQRLRSLLEHAAPVFDPIELHELSGVRRAPRRRWLAMAAACVAVLVVAGSITLIAHRSDRNPKGTEVGSAAALDRLAKDAPCATVRPGGGHFARQAEIRSLRAVAAVDCDYTQLTFGDGTRWSVLIRQVSVAGLPALLTALTAPDDHTPLPKHADCVAMGYPSLHLLLGDQSGHFLQPAWPRTTCGAPPEAVDTALANMTWRTVSITKIKPVTDQSGVNGVCGVQGQSYLPPDAHATNDSAAPDSAPITAICVYSNLDDRGDGQSTRELNADTPAAWTRLTRSFAGHGLSGALPTPEKSCTTQNTYLIVHRSDGNMTTVEVGGCWRVISQAPQPQLIGTVNPTVRAAVDNALTR